MTMNYFCMDAPAIVQLDFDDQDISDTGWLNNERCSAGKPIKAFFGIKTGLVADVLFVPLLDPSEALPHLERVLDAMPAEFVVEDFTVQTVTFAQVPSWFFIRANDEGCFFKSNKFFLADPEPGSRLLNARPLESVEAEEFAKDLLRFSHEHGAHVWYLANESVYVYFPEGSEFLAGSSRYVQ